MDSGILKMQAGAVGKMMVEMWMEMCVDWCIMILSPLIIVFGFFGGEKYRRHCIQHAEALNCTRKDG